MGDIGEWVVIVNCVEKCVVDKNDDNIFEAVNGNELRGCWFFVNREGLDLGGLG